MLGITYIVILLKTVISQIVIDWYTFFHSLNSLKSMKAHLHALYTLQNRSINASNYYWLQQRPVASKTPILSCSDLIMGVRLSVKFLS